MAVVVNVVEACQYDWGSYALDYLQESGRKFHDSMDKHGKASGIGVCIFILLLFYLGHIDIGKCIGWDTGSHIIAWDRHAVECAIKEDKCANGYGEANVYMITHGNKHPLSERKQWVEKMMERGIDFMPPKGFYLEAKREKKVEEVEY